MKNKNLNNSQFLALEEGQKGCSSYRRDGVAYEGGKVGITFLNFFRELGLSRLLFKDTPYSY